MEHEIFALGAKVYQGRTIKHTRASRLKTIGRHAIVVMAPCIYVLALYMLDHAHIIIYTLTYLWVL